jgi:hypothetical protein
MKHELVLNDTKPQSKAVAQRQRPKRKGRPIEPPTGDPDVDVRSPSTQDLTFRGRVSSDRKAAVAKKSTHPARDASIPVADRESRPRATAAGRYAARCGERAERDICRCQ